MDEASTALSKTDHTTCETLCLKALAMARQAGDFDTYLRILRPLQEARRWRRQSAADAAVRLGSKDFADAHQALDAMKSGGLLLLSAIHTGEAEAKLRALADARHLPLVILPASAGTPPKAWRHQTFTGADAAAPAHWFIETSEKLGDRLIASCPAPLGSVERVAELEAQLSKLDDHEKLHQALAAAAKAVTRA